MMDSKSINNMGLTELSGLTAAICGQLFNLETVGGSAHGNTADSATDELRGRLRLIYSQLEKRICCANATCTEERTGAILSMLYISRELPSDGLYSWMDYAEETVEAFISGHPELKDHTSGIRATAEFRNASAIIEGFLDEVDDESGDYASWREIVGRN